MGQGDRATRLKEQIRSVPDFPKPGILFYDITTLLKDKVGFAKLVDHLGQRYIGRRVDLVLGIEAVLPDGRIWNGLRSLRKDNTGYDLRHLFIGSEGTLGIITAAAMRLQPALKRIETAFVAVPTPGIVTVTPEIASPDELSRTVPAIDTGGVPQLESRKDPIRVRHGAAPVAATYSPVNQKVQSSTGSIVIAA